MVAMQLGVVVLLGALHGLAETLPMSGSAHASVARLWLEPTPGTGGAALESIFLAATMVAIAFSIRRRLFGMIEEGIRAIARPSLIRSSPGARDAVLVMIAGGSALIVRAIAAPWIAGSADAPVAVGTGLLLTASALATTWFTPRGHLEAPTFLGAVAVGAAEGIAVAPGISVVAAAVTALLWLGVKSARAVDLALLLSLPALALSLGKLWIGSEHLAAAGLDAGFVIAGLLVAFLSASLACSVLHSLVERRRLPLLALWLVPLGLATIAYARALPIAAVPALFSSLHSA